MGNNFSTLSKMEFQFKLKDKIMKYEDINTPPPPEAVLQRGGSDCQKWSLNQCLNSDEDDDMGT